jgi:thiamine biosynthesis lipoprotein
VSAAATAVAEQPAGREQSAATIRTGVPRQAFVAQIMGLPVSVHVRGPHARDAQVADAVEGVFTTLRADDAMFSTWNTNSAVSRIRRGEQRLGDAHPRIREVAALCVEAERRTDGSFSAWLPGLHGVPVFDPTGLVKGWAVEQAFDCLVSRLDVLGEHDVLMSAGGDIVVTCSRTDTPDWVVGVEDPRNRQRMLFTIPLRRGAVATSGIAARGAHIIDPATGDPATGLLSATVIGMNLTWADVYATAAFVKGEFAGPWVSSLDDHLGILVSLDGTVNTIPGTASA